MKKFLSALVIPILIILVMALPVSGAITEIWESYNTGNDTVVSVYGSNWSAQTFTVGTTSHSVTEIRLLLSATGSPGTLTVGLRLTTTTGDLTFGTIDGNAITATASWYSIPITEYYLEASTLYSIVVRAPNGDAANYVDWALDGSAATYAGGSEYISTNGGVSWAADADDDYMFEVWGNSTLDVDTAKVFSNYLETGDMLVTVAYINNYAPYYPNSNPSRYFHLRLTSTDGATVLAQTVCQSWGYRPGAIYLSASQAVGLTIGTAYRIYIWGDFTGNPSDYYTLVSIDWLGTDLNVLDEWVLLTANSIGENDGTILTTEIGGKEVLNETGGVMFNNGIPALSDVRPAIFQAVTTVPGYGTESWTDAFAGEATWQDQVGSTIATSFTNLGSLFGVDGKAIGAFFLLGLYLALAVLVVKHGINATIGIILAIPFLLLGAWLRFIDIAILAVIGAVLAMIMVYSFWWSRT